MQNITVFKELSKRQYVVQQLKLQSISTYNPKLWETICVHIRTKILREGSYLHPQILSQHLRKEQKEIYIHVLQYVL